MLDHIPRPEEVVRGKTLAQSRQQKAVLETEGQVPLFHSECGVIGACALCTSRFPSSWTKTADLQDRVAQNGLLMKLQAAVAQEKGCHMDAAPGIGAMV